MDSFKVLGIGEELLKAVRDAGFSSPTEIQQKSIPLVVKGKDVIGQAATGSGKTLAFGSGIIGRIVRGKGVQTLVVVPTRELADQVAKALRQFSRHVQLGIVDVYGGVAMSPQVAGIAKADVVVGTPGRILDHIRQGTLSLKQVRVLVLDEADRMLDMGFIQDMQLIIEACPRERQTLLFSATVSQDIQRIAKHYMRDPIFVVAESYVDPKKLTQYYYDTLPQQKFSLIIHLLKKEHSGLIMVFCNTRRNADFVSRNLKRYGLYVVSIHGGLSQARRKEVMEKFHSAKVTILVCTDVAARGLDIKNVSHVYNYDVPPTSTEYIHRIGRTARAGKEGMALTLVSQKDYQNFRRVMEDDELHIVPLEMPKIEQVYVNFQDIRDKGLSRHDGWREKKMQSSQRENLGRRYHKRNFDHRQFRRRKNTRPR